MWEGSWKVILTYFPTRFCVLPIFEYYPCLDTTNFRILPIELLSKFSIELPFEQPMKLSIKLAQQR